MLELFSKVLRDLEEEAPCDGGCWDMWTEEGSVLVNVADLGCLDCLDGTLLVEEDLLTGELYEGEDRDVLVFEVIEPVLPHAMCAVRVVVCSDWTREQTDQITNLRQIWTKRGNLMGGPQCRVNEKMGM